MQSKTVLVPNISCGHCVRTIQTEVAELEGVRRVQANEQTRQVLIEWEAPATWEQIEAKLVEINYPPAQPNVSLA
ncbi:MAG: heavy metal transporter [Candidatus Thermofonsia Clade 1 bacterium]|jgi:copper chaperone CopZ|uniref:Heavy metal transporter n=1 Tax=Candidatus Thermofonsia Clade 1 bacterium TaxID=2364210 RepID=A0A2M8PBT2_9CHLR|nr:MAG: heavy metal transporter [Candidatus Thermofonsia Clade 1 bacterium]RMF52423.1 MAG: cation transporter [Chloroflexota bacterium]